MTRTQWSALRLVFAALIVVLGLPGQISIGSAGVPITLQTLGFMLAASLLGYPWGGASVALYVLLIAVGLPIGAGGRGAESGEEPGRVAREREQDTDLEGDGDERVHVRRDAAVTGEVVRERDDDRDRRECEDPQSRPVAAAEDGDRGDDLDDTDDEAEPDEDAGDDPGDDLGLGRCHLDADSGDIRPQAIPVEEDAEHVGGLEDEEDEH